MEIAYECEGQTKSQKCYLAIKKTRLAVDNIAHLISFTLSAPADDRRENLDEIHPVQCNEIFLENQMNVIQTIQDHFW